VRDPLIVPGRPAADGITWWVMARARNTPTLRVRDAPEATVTPHHLEDLSQGMRAFLVATTGLGADRRVTLEATDDDGRRTIAAARTLPTALTAGQSFTIGLGSCYNWPMDLKEVYRWFPPTRHAGGSPDPIRLCFLLGDQIYMDLEKSIDAHKADAWSEPLDKAPDPWKAYQQQWSDRRYRNFLLKGECPYLFLADDHELWNDYPHTPAWLPWTKGSKAVALERELVNAFDVFQAALNLPPATVAGATAVNHTRIRNDGLTFTLDVAPLSFFVLDTRLGRRRTDTSATPVFTAPEHLDRVVRWLGTPGGFGVLAVAAPVFQGKGSAFDHNLADYPGDYRRLVDAVRASPRPVLILAGDIHRSRLYSLFLAPGSTTPRATEFVASPLSRLREPPGVRPPEAEPVVRGTLGDSGAEFALETVDAGSGGPRFVTTQSQNYGTVTFTLAANGSLQTTMRCWGPHRRVRDGADLLLERTLTWNLT
jgi:hypothetical protein